jgi:poly(3-hydroxybutyrate) depolymerase
MTSSKGKRTTWRDVEHGQHELWHATASRTTWGEGEESTGERARVVLLRLVSTRNASDPPVTDDRVFILGLADVAAIVSGLMATGNDAFGRGAMVAAMADVLGVSDAEAQHAESIIDRISGEVRGE